MSNKDIFNGAMIVMVVTLVFALWVSMIKSQMNPVKQEQVLKQYNNKTIKSITSDGSVMIVSFTNGQTLEIEAHKRYLEYK